MDTAAIGYGTDKPEDRFAAIDPNGQRWALRGCSVVADKKMFR